VADAARAAGGRFLLSTHDAFLVCATDTERCISELTRVMEQEWKQMPVPFDGGRGLRIPAEVKGPAPSWGACK